MHSPHNSHGEKEIAPEQREEQVAHMDTAQPPQVPENQETQSVANQAKQGDTRVALAVTQSRRTKRVKMPSYRVNGPAKWAKAMEGYVSGRLQTMQMVAEEMGCHLNSVRTRAKLEGWNTARANAVAKLIAKVREGEELGIERSKEDLDNLSHAQAMLAASLLAHGQTLSPQAESVSALVQAQANRIGSMPHDENSAELTRRLLALSQVHAQLVDSIRILAGIPHPDKGPGRSRQEPKTTAKEEPQELGRVPVAEME